MIKMLFACHGTPVLWITNPFVKWDNIGQNMANGRNDTSDLTTKSARLDA